MTAKAMTIAGVTPYILEHLGQFIVVDSPSYTQESTTIVPLRWASVWNAQPIRHETREAAEQFIRDHADQPGNVASDFRKLEQCACCGHLDSDHRQVGGACDSCDCAGFVGRLLPAVNQSVSEKPLPTHDQNPSGLHQRYRVEKLYGESDSRAIYFVLRLDQHGDDQLWIDSCREAANRLCDALRARGHMLNVAGDLTWLLESTQAPDSPPLHTPACNSCGGSGKYTPPGNVLPAEVIGWIPDSRGIGLAVVGHSAPSQPGNGAEGVERAGLYLADHTAGVKDDVVRFDGTRIERVGGRTPSGGQYFNLRKLVVASQQLIQQPATSRESVAADEVSR